VRNLRSTNKGFIPQNPFGAENQGRALLNRGWGEPITGDLTRYNWALRGGVSKLWGFKDEIGVSPMVPRLFKKPPFLSKILGPLKNAPSGAKKVWGLSPRNNFFPHWGGRGTLLGPFGKGGKNFRTRK